MQAEALQKVLEAFVAERGPDGEASLAVHGVHAGLDADRAVETSVGFGGEGLRSVIDIQQNGIECLRGPADEIHDVSRFDFNAGVVQRVIAEMTDQIAVPANDFRQQFRHGDCGFRGQHVKCLTQGVPHA